MALFCNLGTIRAGGVTKNVTGLQNHLCGPRDVVSAQFLDVLEFAEKFTLLDRKLFRALDAAVHGH
jgi:hypothetical protein